MVLEHLALVAVLVVVVAVVGVLGNGCVDLPWFVCLLADIILRVVARLLEEVPLVRAGVANLPGDVAQELAAQSVLSSASAK
jgi:hypothetical protein